MTVPCIQTTIIQFIEFQKYIAIGGTVVWIVGNNNDYRISSKTSALLIIRHLLSNIVSNFSAKVVMRICYKRKWNAHADRMVNINL